MEGGSFCLVDSLGKRDSHGDDESQPISTLMLQEDLQTTRCCFHGCSTVSYLNSLHTWEEQLGDTLMMQHLDPWETSSYEGATGEKRILFSPILVVS